MERYDIVCGTDQGRVRSHNEDAVLGHAESGLAILADGMGGYAGGEVASRVAVEEIEAEMVSALRVLAEHGSPVPVAELHEDLHVAARRANAAIAEAARRQPEYEGMGATLVMAVLQPGRITVAHLGDSRAYRWSGGTLEQLTRDHCWLDEQITQGSLSIDALLASRYKNVVTRALGIEDQIELEVHDHPALEGDVFLLCSDGLSDMLDATQIAAVLGAEGTLAHKVQRLIDEANGHGGRDNVSAILMRQAPPPPQGWTQRLMRRLQGSGQ